MPRILEPHEIPVMHRHTWDVWADGQWREFQQESDFPGQTLEQFRGAAKKYALRQKLNFSSVIDKRRCVVKLQMWPKEAPTDDRGDTPPEPATE